MFQRVLGIAVFFLGLGLASSTLWSQQAPHTEPKTPIPATPTTATEPTEKQDTEKQEPAAMGGRIAP
jgi:hypothetical protein